MSSKKYNPTDRFLNDENYILSYKRKKERWDRTIRFAKRAKRFIDLMAILIASPILLPLLALIALFVKLDSKGPVFFRQKRVGKNGALFEIYKFRTMVINSESLKDELLKENQSTDGVIFKMTDDPRVTKVGKYLRKFSLDELPQLFNVAIGNMTLVGPRPPITSEVVQYTHEERKRLDVTPGITCIWQISGRSQIPFKQQVEMDQEYIRSTSLKMDLWILLKTIPAVITGKGAY